jgi:hypothetical protein
MQSVLGPKSMVWVQKYKENLIKLAVQRSQIRRMMKNELDNHIIGSGVWLTIHV